MATPPDPFAICAFPRASRALTDTMALARRKHLIHGLLEIDVTAARRLRRQRAGERFSFTGFVIACVTRAVAENKMMHALTLHTLTVTLGGIVPTPAIVSGELVTRDTLRATLSFDHDIVDGAPAARFAQRLKHLIAGGYDVEEVQHG